LIVTELVTILGVFWLYWSGRGLLGFWPSYFVLLVLLLIAIIDFEHRLIPHLISLPSILIVGVLASLDPSRGLDRTLLGGVVGFGVVLLLYLFGEVYSRWQARRRGEPLDEVAFGFGDVTLATLIGVTVGWPAIVLALMIGVLSAGAFSLGYILWMVVRGRYRPHLPIPYGPFLILGAALVFFGGSELFSSLLLN
jgi:leader peptidase (prepilin peptidase)/N-methyltransferase